MRLKFGIYLLCFGTGVALWIYDPIAELLGLSDGARFILGILIPLAGWVINTELIRAAIFALIHPIKAIRKYHADGNDKES